MTFFVRKPMISPVEQARTLTFPLITISLDGFCCPSISFQVATLIFSKISSTFSIFAHARAFFGSSPPTWGCHPPPSTGHTSLSLSIDSPGVFSAPHHSTTTPDDFKVNFRTHSHMRTCFWANNPPVPSTIDFPGDFRCTTLPLPTSLSISIDLLFTHGWRPIKNPVRLRANLPFRFLLP